MSEKSPNIEQKVFKITIFVTVCFSIFLLKTLPPPSCPSFLLSSLLYISRLLRSFNHFPSLHFPLFFLFLLFSPLFLFSSFLPTPYLALYVSSQPLFYIFYIFSIFSIFFISFYGSSEKWSDR